MHAKEYLTVEEAARALNVSRRTAYRLIEAEKLVPSRQITTGGDKLVVARSEIERFRRNMIERADGGEAS